MLRRACLGLVAAAMAFGMTSTTVRAAPAAEDGATQIVEIPGTGMTATLPAEWRVVFAERPELPEVVVATDVATRQDCHFSLMEGATSAERAAHETVAAVEAQSQHEVVERTFLAVPAGNAVRVAYRLKDAPDDARYVLNEYYLTVPGGVVSIYCSGDEPPADRWLSVVEGIAPIAAEPAPPAAFDPRVRIPDHGFAIDFPEAWLVRSWPGLGPVLGGQLVLRAVTAMDDGDCAGCECVLEDDIALPVVPDAASPNQWREVLTSAAVTRQPQPTKPIVTEVELPAGPAVRADWERWSGQPATTWIYLDGDGRAVAALLCRADAPPADGWRSIAETFERTPADAAAAQAVVATCLGRPATIVALAGSPTIDTQGNHIIVGTDSDDTIRGGHGRDDLEGGPGDDRLHGGAGPDSLDTGPGRDVLDGQDGRDYLDGHDETPDRLRGGPGSDEGWWDGALDVAFGIERGQAKTP